MKNIAYSVDPSVQTDLFVCQFDEEACSPSYAFGPHTRDHVLIHFVASGCGVLYCDGQAYPVASGQGFLILPGEETLYQADSVTPPGTTPGSVIAAVRQNRSPALQASASIIASLPPRIRRRPGTHSPSCRRMRAV